MCCTYGVSETRIPSLMYTSGFSSTRYFSHRIGVSAAQG